MAEIELSVLSRQCLDQRIPDKLSLIREVTPWMHNRTMCPFPLQIDDHRLQSVAVDASPQLATRE
jgi:hypothetical protein